MSVGVLPRGVGASSARWLFSQHFLLERVPRWPEFASLDVSSLHSELRAVWERERPTLVAGANEGLTEDRFIRPVLRLLGHAFTLFPETHYSAVLAVVSAANPLGSRAHSLEGVLVVVADGQRPPFERSPTASRTVSCFAGRSAEMRSPSASVPVVPPGCNPNGRQSLSWRRRLAAQILRRGRAGPHLEPRRRPEYTSFG